MFVIFNDAFSFLLHHFYCRVSQEDAAEFFIKYAKAEEQFGLARHAVVIYDRATKVVPPNKRLDMYRLYAKKVRY